MLCGIKDAIIDDTGRALRRLVMGAASGLLTGRMVPIAPRWIARVGWGRRRATIDLTGEMTALSPAYYSNSDPNEHYAVELHRHYGRPANRR